MTISKITPPHCRFTPSCSEYAINAFRSFGAVKGGYLTLRRIIRCNPFSDGGPDPVPAVFMWRYKIKENN